MNKGLKLVYASAALTALSCLVLQGCGSDASDDSAAPTAGSAGTTAGTSSAGTSAGGTSSGGTSSGGTSSGGTSAGGTSAGGTSAGGTGGEAGAGTTTGSTTAAVCDALTPMAYPTPTPTCDDYCTTWIATCQGLAGIPAEDANKFADKDACLAACADFSPTQMCCRDEHVHNAAKAGAGNNTTHCPHTVGDGICP